MEVFVAANEVIGGALRGTSKEFVVLGIPCNFDCKLSFCHDTLGIEESNKPIDLLVTDVVMPRVSGPELVRCLSTILPEFRVLYMSGYSEEGDLSVMSDEERAVVLQKPFAPGLLLAEIRRILDREPVRSGTDPA